MPELTQAQTPYGTGFPLIGGDFGWGTTYGYTYKSAAGTTILPAYASGLGSGALEGRNAYAPVYGIGAGWGLPGVHAGSIDFYRRARRHPTVALARATIHGPILAAGCSIESDEDKAPDGAHEAIEKHVMPMRNAIVAAALFMLDYGWQAGELVWGPADGLTIVTKFKPLLPELTTFESDDKGNLLRVVNGNAKLTMDRAIVFTNDPEGDSPYGQPRLENLRRDLTNYWAKQDQLFKLGFKASGISVHVGYPPDSRSAADLAAAGDVTNAEKAAQIARDLTAGKSVVFPGTGGLQLDSIEDAIALSKGTLWPITLMDMGEVSGSQAAMLDDLRYIDQLLCRGMLRSERSVIEAQGGGTRAESADHTANISDTDCDAIHEYIVERINRQIVDPMLVENWGEDARGTVRLVANQIVDESRAILLKVLDAWLADPLSFGELLSRMDKDLVVNRLGIKLRKEAEEWPEEMPTGPKELPAPGDEGDDKHPEDGE